MYLVENLGSILGAICGALLGCFIGSKSADLHIWIKNKVKP